MIKITWDIESTHRSPFGGDVVEFGQGTLLIDGFFSQSFDYGLDLSTSPIERSADITDHARPQIKTHKFQCFVSDDPYDPLLQEEDHTQNVLGGLDYLITNAIPIDVETDRSFLEGFIVVQRSGLRDETTGEGAEFSLTIQEILYADLETVAAPSPSVERARPRRDNGSREGSSTGSTQTGSRSPSARSDTLSRASDAIARNGGFSGYFDRVISQFTGESSGV